MSRMPDRNEFVASLRDAGLRLTPQRCAICNAIAGREDHPTAQALYEQLKPEYESLSLTTVYQTLDTLVRIGAVRSLGTAGDESVHYEPNTRPHINLACLTCHRIRDLESVAVHTLEQEVSEATGSSVLSGRVVYYSDCLECPSADNCPFRMQKERTA